MTDLIKYDPFLRPLSFPRWFDDFDESFSKGLKIKETDKDILIEAIVAGISPKNVDVNIEDGVITIKAEEKSEQKNYKYYYSAALSGGQWEKADAEVKHGIVFVTIPKAESARPQKISVRAAKEE